MKKQKFNPEDAARLRQKAEDQLKLRKSQTDENVSEADMMKLIHELRVHQIELELQNEDFVIAKENAELAKEKAELAEEKYIDLYDYAPSGYLTISKEGDISDLNFAAARMLGKERSKLIKSRFALFISEETRSVFNLFVQKVFKSKTKQSCEAIITKEGNPALEGQALPIYVKIEGIVSDNDVLCNLTVVDITERKQAELKLLEKSEEIAAQNEALRKTNIELIAAKEKVEESDRLKSAFLANMSHEIRTPMNGILGFAELLKRPDLQSENQQKYIEIIEKSGARMLNIINDIIDISKIEAGLMKLDVKESNINEQIEYVYTFFKPEVEAKGIKLSFKNPLPAKEAIVKTDREKVYAILTNLVKNAIKYTDEGSIELGYIQKTDSKSGELEFYVKDTGIGVSKERQEAIFDRFIQVGSADKIAPQGAGLGLAITKAYVEMLGGEIWVESEEGKGSTFYFTLPSNTEPATDNNDRQHAPSEDNKTVRKLKILIAEDDEVSEMLLDETVEMFGKEILKARTGVEAVQACRDNPDIDLILMDIQMPEIEGYEATQQIREFNKQVIIIAQTAYGLTGDREKSIEAGCNDYLAKPISENELQAMIQKYFGK